MTTLTVLYFISLAVSFVVFVYVEITGKRRMEQRRRRQLGLCLNCGYNLTGNVSGICPECGQPVAQEIMQLA